MDSVVVPPPHTGFKCVPTDSYEKVFLKNLETHMSLQSNFQGGKKIFYKADYDSPPLVFWVDSGFAREVLVHFREFLLEKRILTSSFKMVLNEKVFRDLAPDKAVLVAEWALRNSWDATEDEFFEDYEWLLVSLLKWAVERNLVVIPVTQFPAPAGKKKKLWEGVGEITSSPGVLMGGVLLSQQFTLLGQVGIGLSLAGFVGVGTLAALNVRRKDKALEKEKEVPVLSVTDRGKKFCYNETGGEEENVA